MHSRDATAFPGFSTLPGNCARSPRQIYQIQKRQRGVALLLIVAVLLLGSAAVFLGSQNLNSAALSRQDTVTRDLQKAKQAMIAYAVTYLKHYRSSVNPEQGSETGPGHLPCPDMDNSGGADSSCPPNIIGRLPVRWPAGSEGRVFELYPFAQSAARQFWYLPSDDFRNNGSGDRIVNSGTRGKLKVDGIDDIVAVIIDPGPPIGTQQRPSDDPADYLEGVTADGDGNLQFVTASGEDFNDRIVYITRDEILPMVERQVLEFVHTWLNEYDRSDGVDRHYPNPAALGDTSNPCDDDVTLFGFLPEIPSASGPDPCGGVRPFTQPHAWFYRNEWEDHIFYHPHEDCKNDTACDSSTFTKKFSINGQVKDYAVLIATFGREIWTDGNEGANPQNRQGNPGDIRQYLDSVESSDGDPDNPDYTYQFNSLDAQNNDQFCVFERQDSNPCRVIKATDLL